VNADAKHSLDCSFRLKLRQLSLIKAIESSCYTKNVHNTYQASLCLLCLQAHPGGPEAQANQNYLLVLEFQDPERLSGLEFPAYQVLLTARHRLESLWHPKNYRPPTFTIRNFASNILHTENLLVSIQININARKY